VESKNIEKKIDESTAFAYLQKEIEKEKRKNRKLSLIGSSFFLLIAILGFLTFGPFQIPVLSQLGNTIMGRDSSEKGSDLVVEQVIDEDEESEGGIVAGEDTITAEEVVEETETTTPATTKKTSTTTVKKTTPTPAPTPIPTPIPEPEPETCTENEKTDYEYKYCYNIYYMGYNVFSAEYYLSLKDSCPNAIYTDYDSCISFYQGESNRAGNLSDTYYSNGMKYKPLLVSCEYSESYLDGTYWDCYNEGYEAAIASFGL
jgi:hypothetical protein